MSFDKMDKKLEALDSRIDSIDVTLARIDVTLEKQSDQLAYHIKRTDLLEAQISPIDKHVKVVNGIMIAVGVMFSVIFGLSQMGVLNPLIKIFFPQ